MLVTTKIEGKAKVGVQNELGKLFRFCDFFLRFFGDYFVQSFVKVPMLCEIFVEKGFIGDRRRQAIEIEFTVKHDLLINQKETH